MQNLDVSPGNGSNKGGSSPPYLYNPPNKDVIVSRPVGTAPKGHYEEGDFNGEAIQNLDVSPGDGSNNNELSPLYPYNPPNKEVDVRRPVAENICNSSTRKKRKRRENKPCSGPVAPVIDVSDDVPKGQGRTKRKINLAPPLLSPYTPTWKFAKKNIKKVPLVSQPTSEEPVIINYFEEDILDQRITKQDIDDVNIFINLGFVSSLVYPFVSLSCCIYEN
ncbi:hypothetical protein MKX03_014882 [Papaver bracteatum]|nr:hypothetical protein MKX03_014882 [Papaver bracteatum]